jgi:hypothetical protein
MTAVAPPLSRRLLDALEALGPQPVLAWYGESARIELSGHVLANWVIKAIGHLHDEVALEPGEVVVLDLAPHWKRLVLALAAWSLGAEVVALPRGVVAPRTRDGRGAPAADDPAEALPGGVEDPRVVVTDRPDSALADTADEVLAVQAVSLAPRYDRELPPLVRDWLVEVRGSSDRLSVPLPAWSGPAPAPSGEVTVGAPTGTAPRLLVTDDGLAAASRVLAVLLAGGGIVGPAAAVAEERAAAEGVTART